MGHKELFKQKSDLVVYIQIISKIYHFSENSWNSAELQLLKKKAWNINIVHRNLVIMLSLL